MRTIRHTHWLYTHTISAALAVVLLLPINAVAAESDTKLEMRPFCTSEQNSFETIIGPIPDIEGYVTLGEDKCPTFIVEDPETLRTIPLRVGDILAIDVIIRNPSQQAITHVRSWMSYDPALLEGVSIDVDLNFPSVTPGESNFDEENGFVMIEASNDTENANKKVNVLVARVQLRVKEISSSGTPISFYDAQQGGHTVVTTTTSGNDENILAEVPGSLHVVFAEEVAEPLPETTTENEGEDAKNTDSILNDIGNLFDEFNLEDDDQSGEEQNTAEDSTSDSENDSDSTSNLFENTVDNPVENEDENVEETPPQRTAFSLLQVRNLRLSTEGTSLLIGWDSLNHADLKAYNIYYGTTSGRYIQRKTVKGDMKSLLIRALPFGTTYYVAVRAVSTADEESAFSREASVEIGNPLTSSSPLVAGTIGGGPNGVNPVGQGLDPTTTAVPGATGLPSGLVLVLVLSAATGTLIAVRRQTIVTSAHHIQ